MDEFMRTSVLLLNGTGVWVAFLFTKSTYLSLPLSVFKTSGAFSQIRYSFKN